MKTTVDLPDEMLHRAKILAAQQRTTLRELVMTGLSLVLETSQTTEYERMDRSDQLASPLRKGRGSPTAGRLTRSTR
jgi:hypothetical protein